MRVQSDTYAPFPAVRRVTVNASIEIVDTDAKANATAFSGDTVDGFGAEYTIDGVRDASGRYAALEHNAWALDGSAAILSDGIGGWYYNSAAMSGEDTAFTDAPYIEFVFSADASTIGWTLYFDDKSGQYPTEILVSWTDADGNTMGSNTFIAAGVRQILEYPVSGYRSVKFEFVKTHMPMMRIHLCEVDFGITREFTENTVKEVRVSYGADTASASLPVRQMRLVIDNHEREYNLLNPDGIYTYLEDGQPVRLSLSVDGEAVFMGAFSFTSASAQDGALTAEIVASDAVLALDSVEFTAVNTEMTLSDAVSRVLDGYDIAVSYNGTAERKVRPAVSDGTSRREALRLLAQAAMCAVWCDRDGILQFTPLDVAGAAVGSITADELYHYNGISVTERVDAVQLTVSNGVSGAKTVYTAGSGTNVKKVQNPCVVDGDAVAAWLLALYKRRKKYAVKNRCDPAVEIGDTITVTDAYGQNGNAVITGIDVTYNGTLYATTKGVGT